MKLTALFGPVLAFHLLLSASPALAHAGHGDEFQATGDVNRVEVKGETDALLGIQVNPIEAAADGSGTVQVPVTALVDDNDRQLVFVQYENFYEPVEVSTGATQGELIEVTEGLSIGEQLVTQGSLSLYAESRKTQPEEAVAGSEVTTEAVATTVETAPSNSAVGSTEGTAVAQSDEAHDQAHADGIAHTHERSGFPVKALIGGGIGVAIAGGLLAFVLGKRGNKGGAL